ncbi:MAG: cysteine--tRNA ligase [Clostridia bacterium]
MELKLYNTLTRTKETFTPINELVRVYSCGPTVYKYAHIGNLRTYIFMDLLVRILRYDGFNVKNVMNITDVGHLLSDGDEGEDKMERSAREQQKTPYEIADEITAQFFKDIDSLNIKRPTITPKATENIPEMIEIVQELLKKGYAYEIDDGIYYDVSKFNGYGKLSRINLDDQKAGARVGVNSQKHNPIDFALWKKAEPNHIMQWDSPWGKGYPGWHIECTAMSFKYLGKHFDIHTGGVDHIPIHHENEIAQGEATTGFKNTNYWMHSEFMLFDGGKMSKSLGNCYTVTELAEKGYSPIDFRYFCLNAQYRQKLNFTFDGLASAKIAYERLLAQLRAHNECNEKTDLDILEKYKQEFIEAINDDINVPMALGVLWKMVKEPKSKDIYSLALEMDKVLGLNLDKLYEIKDEQTIDENIISIAQKRLEVRKAKDWKESDRLREQLKQLGYNIKDTNNGYELEKIQ